MVWSLSYLPPRDPALLDEFFLAVGKALYIANAFEGKCRFVLRIAKLANHFENTNDASATMALANALKDKFLCPTIVELKGFLKIRPGDIELLEKAKDARNYIAHEGASIGPLYNISARQIHKQLTDLHSQVELLVTGDNVVSRWVYEIEEKENAPLEIQKAYPRWVDDWIFPTKRRT
jgi:hypothetical protein